MPDRMLMAKKSNRRGQTILESSLVFLAVLSMLLFIIDMGRLLFLQQYFTERARAGARWAAVNANNGVTAAQVQAYVCFNDSAATGSSGLFGLNTSNVSYTPVPSTGTPQYVQVQISGFQTLRLIPFIAGTYTNAPVTAVAVVQ